jgi:hypothetical protein
MEAKFPPKNCYQYTRIHVVTSTQNTRAWTPAAVEMCKLYTRLTFADSVTEVQVTIAVMVAFFIITSTKILGISAQ